MGRESLSLVQWVGGKGLQLDDLIPMIPEARTYVEPFGGGASLLLNKKPSPVEVYNDLNGNIVNLFRVMRDPDLYPRLEHMLELTLYAKDEFRHALSISNDPDRFEKYTPVVCAWATYVIQNMGISGKHHKSEGNWSRSLQDSKNTERWWTRFHKLEAIHRRLRNVQIDSQDAVDCMTYWDSAETVFYVDPPYVLETRNDNAYYDVELDNSGQERLVERLLTLNGMVVLSGYEHPLYKPLEDAGWVKDQYGKAAAMTVGEGAKPRRIEVVWRNQQAADWSMQRPLFM